MFLKRRGIYRYPALVCIKTVVYSIYNNFVTLSVDMKMYEVNER